MKYIGILVILVVLTGCASEVDKCVNAEMKAWRYTNKTNSSFNKINSDEIKKIDEYNANAIIYNKKLRDKIEKHNRCITPGQVWCDDRNYAEILYGEPLKLMPSPEKPVDSRSEVVVEAEFRKNCFRLIGVKM